jgi:predicted porin
MPGPAVASASDPPPAEESAQLRRLLDELRRRVEALEASTPGRPEVREVRQLLEEAEKRIAVLESAPTAAPPPTTSTPEQMPPATSHPVAAAAAPAAPVAHADRPTKSQLDLNPPEKPKPDDWRRYLPDFYGSLRVRLGATASGEVEIADLGSRIGLQGKAPLGGKVNAVGRLELGFNLVNQNPGYLVTPGGGLVVGEGANPVTTRLGYAGVETPFGTLTYGKQWSVYYSVAGVTDSFWTFGGEAAGSFPVGDGGISGTGRAEQAMNWRHGIGPVSLGLQIQQRTRTENDRDWADTWGAAVGVDVSPSFWVGAAWNEVRDGVPEPGPNEPREGDEAAVLGVRWQKGPFLAAAIYSPTRNHMEDDTGAALETRGYELFLQYDVGRHWQFLGGVNALMPTDSRATDYRILSAIGGGTYRFGAEMLLTGEVRLDWSRKADGSRLTPATVFAFGMNYGW